MRNDRIIAVPFLAKTHEPLGPHTRLDDKLAQTMQDFFVAYNEVQGKKFKPLGIHGPDRALRVIRDSLAQQRKKGRQKS
jgi:inorganic pyrophosphatase